MPVVNAPEDLLTIDDADDLPNGMASIVTVRSTDGRIEYTGRIDNNGFIRQVGHKGDGSYFAAAKYEVVDP